MPNSKVNKIITFFFVVLSYFAWLTFGKFQEQQLNWYEKLAHNKFNKLNRF